MRKTKWYLAGLFSVIAVLAALGIFNIGKVSAQAPLDVPSSTYLQAQSMDEAKPANSSAAANPGVSGKAPALVDTPTATPPCGGAVPGPWATSTPGPATRYRAGGASDGTFVYVYGGSNSSGAYLNDLWKWNPATGVWTQLANMPTAKSNIQGSYWNGKIYVPGGYTGSHIAENAIYDIAANTWSTGAPEPAARSGMTAAYNNKIYVFGGNPGPFNSIIIYDIASNSWSTSSAVLPAATTYGRAITAGNFIYIVGGVTTATTNAVYRYDPTADTIFTVAPLQTARVSEELMTNGIQIFAVAGGDATFFTGVPLAQSVEIYDIASNTWTYGNPIVQKVAAPSGGSAGGKLMIQGGVDNGTYYDLVQVSTLVSGTPCATPTLTPCPINFSDVHTTDYFYEDVRCVYCRGAVSGYADGTFRPYNNTTRGQMTKIIVLALNIPIATPTGTPTFNDVLPTSPFYAYIETAAANGIVSGYSDGTFRPNTNVTRGQLSKIDVVAANHVFGWPILNPATATFSDVPVGSTFYVYIETAVCRGIISGYADGTFRPGNNAIRAQISKIVCRTSQNPPDTCLRK